MQKKIWILISALLTVLLLAAVAADVYISGQINSILAGSSGGDEVKVLAAEWSAIQTARWEDLFFSGTLFAVLGFFVLKVGPQHRQESTLTQEEALKIAQEIEAHHKKNGVYIQQEEEDEDIPYELEMPTLKAAIFENRRVTVTWHPVDYAEGYSVWRMTEGSSWSRIARVKNEGCVYYDYGIDSKTRYFYSIKAHTSVDGTRISSKKDPFGIDTYVSVGNIPGTPVVKCRTDSDGRPYLVWSKAENTRVYRILRKGKDDQEWEIVGRVQKKEPRQFYDETAEPGKTYQYTVSAHQVIDKHVISGEFDEEGITVTYPLGGQQS